MSKPDFSKITADMLPLAHETEKIASVYGYTPITDPDGKWDVRRSIDPHRPMIALTFDDGPSDHTPRLLDLFKKYGGKGTFCIYGGAISGREAILKRTADEGHDIVNHTYNHYDLPNCDEKTVVYQLIATSSEIKSITGRDCHLMRPPGTNFNDTVCRILEKLGMGVLTWSIDTEDWFTKNADAVHDVIMERADDGEIVICHDSHGTTVDAMERVIPELVSAGYQLVTVSELMAHSGKPFEAGKVYGKR